MATSETDRFSVGDRVRFHFAGWIPRWAELRELEGREGVIIEQRLDQHAVIVQLDDGSKKGVAGDCLTLVVTPEANR